MISSTRKYTPYMHSGSNGQGMKGPDKARSAGVTGARTRAVAAERRAARHTEGGTAPADYCAAEQRIGTKTRRWAKNLLDKRHTVHLKAEVGCRIGKQHSNGGRVGLGARGRVAPFRLRSLPL